MVTLQEWCEDTEMHAIKRCTRTEYAITRRIIWVILFTASVAFLAQQLIEQTMFYFSYQHTTKVDIVFKERVDFPTVTICNLNRYRRSKMTAEDLWHVGRVFNILDKNMSLLYSNTYPKQWADWVNKEINWTDIKNNVVDNQTFDLEEFTSRVSHDASETILDCTWQDQFCSFANFSKIVTRYGTCFMFNGPLTPENLSYMTEQPGTGNGLRLYLNVNQDDYLVTGAVDEVDDVGMKVHIHWKHEPPSIRELGAGIQPGLHYFIAIQEQQIKALSEPYGNCTKANDGTVLEFYNTSQYTVSACMKECETRHIMGVCGCRLPEHPGSSGFPVCNPEQFVNCAIPETRKMIRKALCECNNPCFEQSYEYSLSSVLIRAQSIDRVHSAIKHNKNISREQVKNNMVVLNVFFKELSCEIVEQIPSYTFFMLISDIGGTMGLLIGASVLTLLHMLEFFVFKCGGCDDFHDTDSVQKPAKKNKASLQGDADEEKIEMDK